MATIAELREEIRRFAAELIARHGLVANQLVANQPGVALFTQIEDLACEVGDTLAQEVLRIQAAEREDFSEPSCPQCGRLARRKKRRLRVVTSRRGPVEVAETECYCPRCRRSFFPSLGSSGTGSGL